MTKLRNLLFAGLLTAAAILSAPRDAAAEPCSNCYATGSCMACCRCDGGSFHYCGQICP